MIETANDGSFCCSFLRLKYLSCQYFKIFIGMGVIWMFEIFAGFSEASEEYW